MRCCVKVCSLFFTFMAVLTLVAGPAAAQQKPNILIIWGDDIGWLQHQRLQPGRDGLQDAQH